MVNPNETAQKKYRILVIDDEPDVLDSIVDSISDDTYIIESETDSAAALAKINNTGYDLVLTDLMMPGVTGMDIVSAIQKSAADTLVIVITGHATLNTAIESLQLGVYDYVRKPFQSLELKSILKRATEILDLQRANKQLNEKNKRILEKLSFIIDVSEIMYQLTNLDALIEMLMDTVESYFGFERCAFLKEDLKNDTFHIARQTGLDRLDHTFYFSGSSYINHQKVPENRLSVILINDGQIKIDDRLISFDPGRLYLLPLMFQGHVIGFVLLAQDIKEAEANDETITLLNVFLAQIAPAIHGLIAANPGGLAADGDLVHFIRNQLNYARSVLSPVGFTIFRFEFNSPSGDMFSIQDMFENVQKFVGTHVNSPTRVRWLTQDTVLLVFPETDLFDVESESVSLKHAILSEVLPKEPDSKINIIHACLSSADRVDSAVDVMTRLWSKLFHEVQMAKNEKSLVHIN